ncbi:conserved hypothetical protein [Formosa agariphila KMM 3901]|uniref:Deoxyribose-phosphate aldolase n=1 Tax=Formosa agariphila (strain DSM 15362 / KCTC 12365 / LMG 23005 / KMM 3901 / M-2Alg 35-1) TaxID=1347342 RepID=T2KLA2_FORAG|nr:DUF6503 family protein [Formosa agariphila]CDF78769.1 conserved hypothetical protein [Formosa agariphila KMM 3901]
MHIFKSFLILFTIGFVTSCNTKEKKQDVELEEVKTSILTEQSVALSKSETLINEAIAAHGGDLYNTAQYAFVFRDKTYSFKNNGSSYEYTKTYKKGDSLVVDVLKNGNFSRTVNDEVINLSEKEVTSGTGAVNSVIYFATLPHKLNDEAVNSKFIETISIKNDTYNVIEVTFNQEGGGEDHDDEYMYWINENTKKIDYLAYNYSVNEGGVRFRVAYNKRVVDGITFQDYTNYEATVGTPLKNLPMLFEANKLKELSKIKTEEVVNLNK